jgi:hypothetical protein
MIMNLNLHSVKLRFHREFAGLIPTRAFPLSSKGMSAAQYSTGAGPLNGHLYGSRISKPAFGRGRVRVELVADSRK